MYVCVCVCGGGYILHPYSVDEYTRQQFYLNIPHQRIYQIIHLLSVQQPMAALSPYVPVTMPLWLFTLGQYILGDDVILPWFNVLATLAIYFVTCVVGLLIKRSATSATGMQGKVACDFGKFLHAVLKSQHCSIE